MDNTNSTQKNQLNQQNTLKYVRLPLEMLSEPWVANADIIVYAYMLNRFSFFKGLQKSYYENIKDIAEGVKQDETTVKRSIKKLKEHSYLTVSKVKVGLGVSNSYDVVDVHSVMDVKPTNTAADKPKVKLKKLKEDEDDNLPW